MRQLIDQLRKKNANVAVLLATASGTDKVVLVAGLSKSLVERGLSAGHTVLLLDGDGDSAERPG